MIFHSFFMIFSGFFLQIFLIFIRIFRIFRYFYTGFCMIFTILQISPYVFFQFLHILCACFFHSCGRRTPPRAGTTAARVFPPGKLYRRRMETRRGARTAFFHWYTQLLLIFHDFSRVHAIFHVFPVFL